MNTEISVHRTSRTPLEELPPIDGRNHLQLYVQRESRWSLDEKSAVARLYNFAQEMEGNRYFQLAGFQLFLLEVADAEKHEAIFGANLPYLKNGKIWQGPEQINKYLDYLVRSSDDRVD